jgi:hypothetical protein
MCDEQNREDIVEELQDLGQNLMESIETIKSFEVYKHDDAEPIHLSFGDYKHPNEQDFLKYLQYNKGDELLDSQKLNITYMGIDYSFNRVVAETEDYTSFMLISKQPVDRDEKRGMLVVVDATGVVFLSTCKSNLFGQFNLDFISAVYNQ